MNLWSVGLDYRQAPLALRSQAIPESKVDFINAIAGEWTEKVWIQTCNRVEIYGVGDFSGEHVVRRWTQACQLGPDIRDKFKVRNGIECLLHLFRVASSIESMVIGETQITGQIKQAYQDSIVEGWVGPSLHKVFQRAFKVAKGVRSKTEIGRFAVSIPSVGVKLAERVMGPLSELRVAILGLGEIGENAAEHFASVAPKELILFNRTESIAKDLVSRFSKEGVSSRHVTDWKQAVLEADVIVSAVSVLLVKRQDLDKLCKSKSRLFVLDLGVPASVEEVELNHLFLFRVDDLKKTAEENAKLRSQEIEKADSLVAQEAESLWKGLGALSIDQALRHLAKKMDDLRQEELKSLKSRLPELSIDDWVEIEKMSSRLMSKVVQDPMVELKSLVESTDEKESVIEFFRSLFRI